MDKSVSILSRYPTALRPIVNSVMVDLLRLILSFVISKIDKKNAFQKVLSFLCPLNDIARYIKAELITLGADDSQNLQVNNNLDIINEGIKYYGLKEKPGKESDPILYKMISEVFGEGHDDGEISWCGLWLGMVFDKLGYEKPDQWWVARNWAKIGEPVELKDIQKGDLVIYWRYSPQDWRGHVHIYSGDRNDEYLYGLGGNQRNEVSVAMYPISRIVAIRRFSQNIA